MKAFFLVLLDALKAGAVGASKLGPWFTGRAASLITKMGAKPELATTIAELAVGAGTVSTLGYSLGHLIIDASDETIAEAVASVSSKLGFDPDMAASSLNDTQVNAFSTALASALGKPEAAAPIAALLRNAGDMTLSAAASMAGPGGLAISTGGVVLLDDAHAVALRMVQLRDALNVSISRVPDIVDALRVLISIDQATLVKTLTITGADNAPRRNFGSW